MLLRFSVSNHRSIKNEQELSMIATSLKDSTASLIDIPNTPKSKALPSAVIFGPNASGKSNMVAALARFKRLILESHRSGEPNAGIRQNSFALDPAYKSKPTCFDADLIINGVRYHYGFAYDGNAFQQEWLFSFPEGIKRKLFERTGPNTENMSFGPSLKGKKQLISEIMRDNSLYLSAAAQNNHKELSDIVKYVSSINFNMEFSVGKNDVKKIFIEDKIDSRIISFLRLCKTGIIGYRESKSEETSNSGKMAMKLMEAIGDFAKEESESDLLDEEKKNDALQWLEKFDRHSIHLEHEGENCTEFFTLDQESAGTLRLLSLLHDVFHALDNGQIIIVDEIDASLHTQVCEALLYLFADKRINKYGAQIIATTHDTNLLRSPSLRRDQIWLVEKNELGASEFYSLADIKTRSGDNFELGYMQGRYGAVPFTEPVAELFASLAD